MIHSFWVKCNIREQEKHKNSERVNPELIVFVLGCFFRSEPLYVCAAGCFPLYLIPSGCRAFLHFLSLGCCIEYQFGSAFRTFFIKIHRRSCNPLDIITACRSSCFPVPSGCRAFLQLFAESCHGKYQRCSAFGTFFLKRLWLNRKPFYIVAALSLSGLGVVSAGAAALKLAAGGCCHNFPERFAAFWTCF